MEQAQDLDVDYLGVSPVFETPTKTDTKGAWGLDGLARVRAFSRHPLVAIGGLNRDNVAGRRRGRGRLCRRCLGYLQRSRSRDRGPGAGGRDPECDGEGVAPCLPKGSSWIIRGR